ncbi:MAG TPA: acyltransferase family protein [Acidobacteriaceae bacterium]|nr:acyltransferase family protein [Acidobacteriaceae bacterium]
MATPAITTSRESPARRKGFLTAIAFQSSLARSGKYRADVDGLRAVAVLAVMFFHAKIFGCSGGFVGVDVFFVISGYLITSLIAKDLADGNFSFISFYERRMRRIFPALFGVLLFCIPIAFVIFSPQELLAFGKSLAATTFFVSNFYFWRNAFAFGYFANSSQYQTLLHTWSLAVEEQFYIVFPAVLALLFRWRRKLLNPLLLFFAAASFALNVWGTWHKPVPAFYLFIPRAWELLIGALLATRAVPPLRSRAAREVAGLLGLCMIAAAVFTLSSATRFPGFSVLMPCVGAWLLIYAGENGPTTIRALLSFRPLVFIGIISYSLYLWHWPLLVFSRYFSAGDLTGAQTAIVLLASAIMAFVSFEYIERPFRGAQSSFTRRQIFALGLAASIVSAAIGFTASLTHGLPQRYSPHTRQLVAENMARQDDYDNSCGNWRTEIHTLADVNFCQVGSASSKKIMFWGDSHVGQIMPLVRTLYREGDLQGDGALFAIADGCLPSAQMNTIGGYHCDTFAKFAIQRARESDIDAVFIGFDTWWYNHDAVECLSVDGRCTKTLTPAQTDQRLLAELAGDIHALRALGKRVIVCLPFPMYDKSIPLLELRNAVFAGIGLGGKASDFTSPVLREQVRSLAAASGAEIFDPRASLCPTGSCITELNGVSIYIDSHHLAQSQIGILEQNLQQVLQ